MSDNVQCPVCTLYLHAGMNLSDHLETHPKEQVIRALVQMTISGGTASLASVLKGENNVSEDTKTFLSKTGDKSLDNDKSNDLNITRSVSISSSSISNSTSNSSVSNQSAASCQNSINALNFSNTHTEDNVTEPVKNVKSSLKSDGLRIKETSSTDNNNENFTNSHHTYLTSTIELADGNNEFAMFGDQRFHHQQQQPRRLISHQHQLSTPSPMPPPTAPQELHSEILRSILPTPLPLPHSMPSQSISGCHSLPAQQMTNSPPTHNLSNVTNSHGRQSHIFTGPHQQPPPPTQHQQDIKVIYSSGLPPPPPLQLFSYQQTTSQLQHHHQKPPPAYGAAISQIRSQNKHQVAGTPAQHQHASIPTHHTVLQEQHQQQPQTIHHNHIRIHSAVPLSPPAASKQVLSKTNDVIQSTSSLVAPQYTRQNSHHQQQQNKYFVAQQQQNSDVENQEHYNNSLNANNFQNKSAKGSGVNTTIITHSTQPQVAISPTMASASMAAVAASTLGRHTNSPFAALLAAAAGAPSPSSSSVLRYAESPVAHYLERDNGDFIVQETPKHIVECVEKDNGEFSVIERIYQSPPSVLHIHDDDDIDADDKNKANNVNKHNDNDGRVSKEEMKEGYIKSQIKKIASSTSPAKEDNNQYRDLNKMAIETKKTNRKLKQMSSLLSDNEIVDFVSISSDSDDEEFISHERNDQKYTTEKTNKNELSVLSTTSTSSHVQPSTPLNTDAHAVQSTSYSPSSSNTVSRQTGTRKKSSKNTITVLSDVQLNLNEYLDLVGNIIASSKVAAQRRTYTAIGPIPLVKIEKEEPIDDYASDGMKQPLLPTSLKANKQETEDITDNRSDSSYSNKPNNISLINQTERVEKKPQILENSQEGDIGPTSTFLKNSSQVTSVIRMATTSQHPQQEQHQEINKINENISEMSLTAAEDSSNRTSTEAVDPSHNLHKTHLTTQSKSSVYTTLSRKGPKKLVIKPKSLQKDMSQSALLNIDDQRPTTSAKALEEYTKHMRQNEALNENEVKVKNEPITSITFENSHQHQGYSILEPHLTSKEPIMECKEEKPCLQESSLSNTINKMKVENNVNEDARVLYDFATSRKTNTKSKSLIFPSATSIFGKNKKSDLMNGSKKTTEGYSLHSEDGTSYSLQSAIDARNRAELENATNTPMTCEHNESSQMFSDFPFNYLYNSSNNNVSAHVDKHSSQQFNAFFPKAATSSKSIKSSMALEDSSSSKNYSEYNQQQPLGTQNQWFNSYQTVNTSSITSNHSNTNISTELLKDNEVEKYLDLDECKREQNVDIVNAAVDGGRPIVAPPPSSSTSCSFTGATENSITGICSTARTLNIRTDEKMPAKGEISEQESNCDIDNSWSQPVYGDVSGRFFKTAFPGMFQQDNGWNHEEYFTVQDLSSTTTHAVNINSNKAKSFEFRLPSEGNNSAGGGNSVSSGVSTFCSNSNDNCNMDVMPSTSAKIRKRRKRSSQEQPSSTVTSQQLMERQNEVQTIDYNCNQQQQEHLPSTSLTFMAGPSNVEMAIPSTFSSVVSHESQSQQQPRIRTKVYECGHCNAKYPKLKDRNAHMIDVHKYVRQNRRLVCLSNEIAVPTTNVIAMAPTSVVNSDILAQDLNTDDFKQGVVKIENENIHREASGFETFNANLRAKTEEIDDDKQNVSLVPISTSTSTSQIGSNSKPLNFQPLSLTTTTSKLTTLYRMLVTFNMTTLKQNQKLSEFDESLIKSSIFFCYICRQHFNSVKLYDAHLTEHPAECFTCGKKFQRWKNFSLHLKRHLGWKEFGCTICEKKFVVRSALVEHMRMHSGLSPLKCKVCGKHFKRYSNLTQHRKRHSKQVIRRKEYVCYCGEVLPSKARFLWHKETHESKPKCCPHCCDRFVHVNSLRRHIRLAHSDKFDYTEPMECPICKQIFAKASMKAHMATHSTDTQYDCSICNKSFSTKWNLKIHSWVHANRTSKPFKCEHCPKAFVREVDFKNHMNSHKQIKPYTCEVCGCKFIRKYNYMRHRREHHGNKKYTCDLCKKSFHRHYYLIEHRRIHTGERPFQCTICGKSSTTKTNHNKHLKIHHSRDPFTVEV